ncbi:MAG: hypothetical protein J6I68_14225 [Butyrivibrio sp.]|uniref:hypothetical protein n=1 Tax=Butyrivibrio sp. TaxID=28121 RepID=UPI001B7A8407|nr:hypothetical protein [Butyrivibrio sp.]MBP3784398.1 hypothetical protein [Butyrivibrio sp.]
MKTKRYNIIFSVIVIAIVITMLIPIFTIKKTWSYQYGDMDYDGNGFVTQDEKIRYLQEIWGVDYDPNDPQSAANELQQKYNDYAEEIGVNNVTGETSSSGASQKKETHTHSYTATVTKDATCTEAGEMTYTCSCGDSYTEVIAMKSHNYESTVTKEPTCTETGTETKECADCGDTIESVIPALGHKAGDWVTEKEATCSEEGRNVRYCTVCGEPVETMMVDKLPHTEGKWEVSQNASLIKPGLRVIKCTECGEILQQEEIPANTTLLYILIGVGAIILIGIIVGVVVYKCRH